MNERPVAGESEDVGGWGNLEALRRAAVSLEGLKDAVGMVNPRPPGWRNDLIQFFKKSIGRALAWQLRPQMEFNAAVTRSLTEVITALEHISREMCGIEERSERRGRREVDLSSIENALVILQDQITTLNSLQKVGNLEAPAAGTDAHMALAMAGKYRTAYVIGLFGTGRRYINELIVQNMGERAKYYRDTIRLHAGPTPMIYSGHATIKHVPSFLQYPPEVSKRILEAVGSGFADLIFLYRHPLDSLLTNWVWWQTYIRENRMIAGISQVFKNTADLCDYLEQNFAEFEAFAEGAVDYYAGVPGSRFLSFAEFVEETDLLRQAATLALRLEDFMTDPPRQFCRLAQIMGVDYDPDGSTLACPKTKPYGYLAVKKNVPRFNDFIEGLNLQTRSRIQKIGYQI